MPLDRFALFIPSMLYAVVGVEMNLYYDGVFSSIYPFHSIALNVSTSIPADVSQQQDERWTFTPGAQHVGDWTFRLDAAYAHTPEASATATLRVRPASLVTPVTRRLLVIGDSTTAHGEWLAELLNLTDGTGLTLATVGTKTATASDAGKPPAQPQARTVTHEAVPGWSIAAHYSDPTSVFVFGGAFSFPQYLAAHPMTLAAGDWVVVALGINDVFSYTDDTACLNAIATMTTRLNAMLASIQSAVPGVRIGLALTIPPSHSQDAFAANYFSGQTRAQYQRNRDQWVAAMLATWGSLTAQGVYLIPIHGALDTRHNMLLDAAKPVNARNTGVLVTRQNNGVHPAQSGYWQCADSYFAFFRGNEL